MTTMSGPAANVDIGNESTDGHIRNNRGIFDERVADDNGQMPIQEEVFPPARQTPIVLSDLHQQHDDDLHVQQDVMAFSTSPEQQIHKKTKSKQQKKQEKVHDKKSKQRKKQRQKYQSRSQYNDDDDSAHDHDDQKQQKQQQREEAYHKRKSKKKKRQRQQQSAFRLNNTNILFAMFIVACLFSLQGLVRNEGIEVIIYQQPYGEQQNNNKYMEKKITNGNGLDPSFATTFATLSKSIHTSSSVQNNVNNQVNPIPNEKNPHNGYATPPAVDDDDDDDDDGVAMKNPTRDTNLQNEEITTVSTMMTSKQQSTTYVKNNTTSNTSNDSIVPFAKQPGVVIVTKIHGKHQLGLLEQSLCLLHHAYNHRPLYDIIVFTTVPIVPQELSKSVETLVSPAKITFVVDNNGLQEEISAVSEKRRRKFLKRCNVSSPTNITWWSDCPGRIAYNWQAQFRSWHIWTHPALDQYKYMMWIDTDTFCTKEWQEDPITTMIRNELVILFDNFPQGANKAPDLQKRIHSVFNKTICRLWLQDGHLNSKLGNYGYDAIKQRPSRDCLTVHKKPKKKKKKKKANKRLRNNSTRSDYETNGTFIVDDEEGEGGNHNHFVKDIHGFFHITNLDFYRTPIVQEWAKALIGDCFLCRRYDDQVAVTVPAAILAPDKSWDMQSHNIHVKLFHNYLMDGKERNAVGSNFIRYWKDTVKYQFYHQDTSMMSTATNRNDRTNRRSLPPPPECPITTGAR